MINAVNLKRVRTTRELARLKPDDLVNTKEIAKILDISVYMVAKLRKNGSLGEPVVRKSENYTINLWPIGEVRSLAKEASDRK